MTNECVEVTKEIIRKQKNTAPKNKYMATSPTTPKSKTCNNCFEHQAGCMYPTGNGCSRWVESF